MCPQQDAQNAAILAKHKCVFVDPQLSLVGRLWAITSKTTRNTVIALNMEAICSFETLETPLLQGVQTLKTNCVRRNCVGVPNIRVLL
jgi:hypothetical protein